MVLHDRSRSRRPASLLCLAAVAVPLHYGPSFLLAAPAGSAPPKKPLTAYNLFIREQMGKIVQNRGEGDDRPAVKIAGEIWKAMSDDEKASYVADAADLKAEYEENLQAFKDAGGVIPRQKRKRKTALKTKEGKMGPAPPKQPPNAYLLFMRDERASIYEALNTKNAGDVGREGGARWRALSDEEKQPYKDEYEALKQKYLEAKAEFEGLAATEEAEQAPPEGLAATEEAEQAPPEGLAGTEEAEQAPPEGLAATEEAEQAPPEAPAKAPAKAATRPAARAKAPARAATRPAAPAKAPAKAATRPAATAKAPAKAPAKATRPVVRRVRRVKAKSADPAGPRAKGTGPGKAPAER